MQLEKTDGPTHPDETLGNDADAGKIPPPENNGPSASLRDDSDNGPCPAMLGAAGPGNGAAHRCAAHPDFLLDRSAKAS